MRPTIRRRRSRTTKSHHRMTLTERQLADSSDAAGAASPVSPAPSPSAAAGAAVSWRNMRTVTTSRSGSPTAVVPDGKTTSDKWITVSIVISVISITISFGMFAGVQRKSMVSTAGSTRPPFDTTAFAVPSRRTGTDTVISSERSICKKSTWLTVRRTG